MHCPLCQLDHPEGAPCPSPVGTEAPLPAHAGVASAGYRLVRELGRGAAGVVYLAEHGETGLPIAIKLLPPELARDRAQARRFAIEARCTNRVLHEALVNVFDFNDDDPDGAWLVMEYVQGATLADVVARGAALEEGLDLLEQLAGALDAAHAAGVVHGGLIPQKVMVVVEPSGAKQVKVLPFGVDAAEPDPEDVPFARLGDPLFRAPEQTRGAPPNRFADVYALGGLAYLLATGRLPFTTLSPEALERAHAEVVPDAPHRVKREVPRPYSMALMKALEKDPQQRYPSASAFVSALRAALRQQPPVSPAPAPASAGGVVAPLAEGFVVTEVRASPVPAPPPASSPSPAPGRLVPVPAPMRSSPSPVPQKSTPSPAPMSSSPSPAPMSTSPSPAPSSPSGVGPSASSDGLVLRVSVTDAAGKPLGDFACSNVTRQGLVVCSDTVRPTLLGSVKLTFADLDGLSCEARVVQHITIEQATQWKMSPGFSVQFEGLSQEQRTRLESAHLGLLPPETPSAVMRRPDDPAAADVLRRFTPDVAKDGYAMLGLSKAAPFDALKDRLRDARRALDGLKQRPLSPAQATALEEARSRLELIGGRLIDPLERLEYDAERGNFEGVARSIGAGIPVAEVEAVRGRFLEQRPDLDEKSRARLDEGKQLETAGQQRKALELYTAALIADPLNIPLHQRYWSLRRQLG